MPTDLLAACWTHAGDAVPVLGRVHLEVELLENWWTTGKRRRESDATRTSLLTAAEALGARQIKIGPDVEVVDGAVPPLSATSHWAAELHQLAAQAAEVGTRVALEPLPFSNITDFRLAAELVTEADHPAAGLVVDIWHLERGPSTLTDLAEIPADLIFAVELNDALRHSPPICSATPSRTGCCAARARSTSGASSRHCSTDAHRTTIALFDSPT